MKDLTFKKYQKMDGLARVEFNLGLDLLNIQLLECAPEAEISREKLKLLGGLFHLEPTEENFEALKRQYLTAEGDVAEIQARKKDKEIKKIKNRLKEVNDTKESAKALCVEVELVFDLPDGSTKNLNLDDALEMIPSLNRYVDQDNAQVFNAEVQLTVGVDFVFDAPDDAPYGTLSLEEALKMSPELRRYLENMDVRGYVAEVKDDDEC